MKYLSQVKPRKSVMNFARVMELVLKDNDHKGGWRHCSNTYLKKRIHEEVAEFTTSEDTRELVDIANFCLMYFQNNDGFNDERILGNLK